MRTYVVTYDIRDPRRWRRVYACLKRCGVRLQYSVFLVRLGRSGLETVTRRLSDAIDHRADDVRIYPVPDSADWTWLGEGALPEAVHLIAAGHELPPRWPDPASGVPTEGEVGPDDRERFHKTLSNHSESRENSRGA